LLREIFEFFAVPLHEAVPEPIILDDPVLAWNEREPPPLETNPSIDKRSSRLAQDRKIRIWNEMVMIAPDFSNTGGVYIDEKNCDWLILPQYPLPSKWNERWAKLLIFFPEGYPVCPPVGFYLNRQFKLKTGGSDPHLTGSAYHGAPDLRECGWYWYCVTIQGWRPSTDYQKADNLRTFLASARESLTNDY
jgi:ubiquitin-protein ligase